MCKTTEGGSKHEGCLDQDSERRKGELGTAEVLTYVHLTEANMEVGFPGGSDGKESAYNVGDLSLISGS